MNIDRRKAGIVAFVLGCLTLYTGWYTQEQNRPLENEYQDIIRFHVIANSDSKEDQALKLKVRDGVLDAVNEELVRETMAQYEEAEEDIRKVELDVTQSRAYIDEHLDMIEDIAEEIIKEQGYEYEVTAELGVRWIPEKTYGDSTFPAGNYEALNITIGEGKGQNWWCVLFPPLCLIDSSADNATRYGKEDFRMEVGTKPAIQLKFKTLELLNKGK